MARLPLVLCTLLLCAPALHAQAKADAARTAEPLPPGCTRELVRPLRGDDAERDSIRQSLRRAVREDAIAAARAAGVAEPAGLFLILFDRRNPATGSFRAYRTNVPTPVLQGVFDRAAARLRAWPERGDAAVSVRLDADAEWADPAPGAVTVECEPLLVNRPEIARLVRQYAEDNAAMAEAMGRRSLSLEMLLSRDGEVVYADVERPSGDTRLDAFVLSLAPRLRLRVATIDGKPRDTWVTLPISTGNARP